MKNKQAIICDKWDYRLNNNYKDESHKENSKRSYLYFVQEKQELVSSKCLATEWLIKDLADSYLTIREYFAGAGVSTIIFQNVIKPTEHVAGDLDYECYNQLSSIKGIKSLHEDGHKSILKNEKFDIKICDFPKSSIIQITRGLWSNFLALFLSKPKYVIWTDTSRTYPISIHKEKYEKILQQNINNYEEYFEAMSKWLESNTGYSINKVAYRGKNANYILASPNKNILEHKYFNLENEYKGFVWR